MKSDTFFLLKTTNAANPHVRFDLIRSFVFLLASILCAHLLRADVFVWNVGGSKPLDGGDWRKTENWVDTNGNAVVHTPTVGDDIRFSTTAYPGAPCKVVLYTASIGEGIGKVTGGPRFQLQLYKETSSSQNFAQRMIIGDPNDFAGLWHVSNPNLELLFTNSASFTPRLAKFATQGRPIINVTNAEARVKIGLLQARNDYNAYGDASFVRRGGVLEKIGPGTLEIEEAGGQDEFVYLRQGTLSLDGRAHPSGKTEAILRRAWLRLDAANASTLMTRTGDDGRLYVTNWADANGSGRSAHSDTMKNVASGTTWIDCMNDPFVSPFTSSSGLPLVDFGAESVANEAKLGPRNGALRFDECKNVQELFIVRWRTDTTVSYTSIIGHHSKYPLHAGGNNILFDGNSDIGVRDGEIRVNGVSGYWGTHPADECSAGFKSLFLLNVAPTNAISLDLLGNERYLANRSGGCRIAEVLIFTEKLTSAERAQVNEYLMNKWFKEYVPCDLGAVVAYAGTVLDVPAGRIARIHRLKVRGTKLTKTGGGALIVDEVTPANIPLDVRGGTVSIKSLADKTITDDAPAANPFVWLDATAAATLVFSNDVANSKSYLTNWTDRAGGSVSATIPWSSANFVNHFPTVKAGVPSEGLAVVDFGDGSADATGTGSWMWLTTRGEIAYEGFMVARATGKKWGNLFGTSANNFMRNGYNDGNTILNRTYASTESAASHWFLNGGAEDPFNVSKSFAINGAFDVVSFSASAKRETDLLAHDRLYTPKDQGLGCQQIGELILYNRRLTDIERRSTEAYLMKKWLKKAHPATDEITDYVAAFGDGEDRLIASDRDVTVTGLTGGTTRYVKRGSGTATIEPTLATLSGTNGTHSFEINSGSLVVSYAYPVQPIFRFDASADSFPDTYEENGNIYVRRWNDADGRSVYAYACFKSKSVTNATLRTKELRTGVARRVVDFGSDNSKTTSAGMRFSESKTNVREAFAVESDKGGGQCLLSAINTYCYLRSWDPYRGLIHNYNEATSFAYNGYIAVDGEEKSPAFVPSSSFHVFNFAPTNNTTVDTIALDRTVTGGGLDVCEQIGFSEKLTAERRAVVTQALRAKWFAEGDTPVWTNTLDAVALNGGSLTLSAPDGIVDDRVYNLNTLVGYGTLVADALVVVQNGIVVSNDALTVSAPIALTEGATWRTCVGADGIPAALNVSGRLTVEGRVTIELLSEGQTRLKAGSYALANVDGGCVADAASWAIEPSVCLRSREVAVSVRNNGIWLDVQRRGFVILLH